ncbi:MAG: TonB-dependent receptor, partial [Candidatus Zixiibacteriota bacterium]
SGRKTHIEVELQRATIEIEGTVVTAGYYSQKTDKSNSTTDFSAEEVRRSPGSAGDVSRIISILPSIAKVNDQVNSLIVRGGTPTENAFYLDNIEIPNINHYPIPGSSGGPISLINVDFIQDVSFSAGGFSALYGDRLSSVVELKFREGNREELDAQLDLNFAGIGITAEGPLVRDRGSWMFSVRRSYLDLLTDAIGTGVAPRYSDYQGKLVYDLSPKHRLSVLGVAGVDLIEFEKEQSIEDGNSFYGKWDGYEYAAGVNWRFLWSSRGYSNTALSVLGTGYRGDFYETKSDKRLTEEFFLERLLQIRNVNTFQFSDIDYVEFGVEAKLALSDYDYVFDEYTNVLGDTVPRLIVDKEVKTPKVGAFAGYTWRPAPRLSATWGVRFDYAEYNEQSHVSPRLSLSYRLSERTTLNAATGVFYQNLPLSLLAQRDRNRDLKDPLAYHYVLGVSHLLTESTKLTVEGYYKRYDNFPMDPMQPQLFVADELVYRGFFGNYENLVDEGEAEAYGVELTLQKKLVQGIYGLLSASYFRARYKDLNGMWRNRVIDNQAVFGVEGGYKPNNKWELSVRWIYAGGPPYTPLDLDASRAINRSVYDRMRVNESRYPDYHSLNLRVDRRFHYRRSSVIAYLSVWNVYNRKNVSTYYWNEIEGKEDVIHQWSLLPVGGVEFEF